MPVCYTGVFFLLAVLRICSGELLVPHLCIFLLPIYNGKFPGFSFRLLGFMYRIQGAQKWWKIERNETGWCNFYVWAPFIYLGHLFSVCPAGYVESLTYDAGCRDAESQTTVYPLWWLSWCSKTVVTTPLKIDNWQKINKKEQRNPWKAQFYVEAFYRYMVKCLNQLYPCTLF